MKSHRIPALIPLSLVVAAMMLRLSPLQSAEVVPETATVSSPATRTVMNFDDGWRFSKGDFATAMSAGFDDASWRSLNLPHDWSIEEPPGPEYAAGTGYAPGGIGWYRKTFSLDASAKGRLVAVEFDGVYNHAQVWINGQFVGGRPYGYASFECDLTPYLKFGPGAANVLAVRVDHTKFADSRWYNGSGIYRHVRLRLTDKLHIAPWGTYVTTPKVGKDSAAVRIETEIQNDLAAAAKVSLLTEILSPSGHVVATKETSLKLPPGTSRVAIQEIAVPQPELWSVDAPRLYTVRSRISAAGKPVDETATPFGIRTIRFDADKGFFLNDVSLKLKGVCLHHDAGCLGAAVPEKVLERRLRILKSLGVNAIRTSHNPPAPELLDLCDRLGFLVKDEAFDEFTPSKRKWVGGWNKGEPSRFGYAEDFAAWSVRDIQDMVRRDRNHPSIILWSIGNEIDYANDPFSHPVLGAEYHPENPAAENLVTLGRPLVEAVHQLDRTRPVTAALATVAMSDAVGFGELLDVAGYNYQESRYPADHAKYPRRVIFGSETFHTWAAWQAVRTNDYISGQFLWTGIDYLGEAGEWPNHVNGSGLLDVCGFKKPLAWFRQSLWSDEPMVYLCAAVRADPNNQTARARRRQRGDESWNWPSNSTVAVRCFTTCPEVELTLNGRSLGIKHRADAREGVLFWEVPFEPGTLTAIGRDGTKNVCEFSLKTAGAARRIELLPDTTQLAADGKDVCQVEFRVVDDAGVLVPDADDEITFSLQGPGKILGVENGDLNNTESYQGETHRVFHGRGLLILQSQPAGGTIELKASAPDLDAASVTLNCR